MAEYELEEVSHEKNLNEIVADFKNELPKIGEAINEIGKIDVQLEFLNENPELFQYRQFKYKFLELDWPTKIYGINFSKALQRELKIITDKSGKEGPVAQIFETNKPKDQRLEYAVELDPDFKRCLAIRIRRGVSDFPFSIKRFQSGKTCIEEAKRYTNTTEDELVIRELGREDISYEEKNQLLKDIIRKKIEAALILQNFFTNPFEALNPLLFSNYEMIRKSQFITIDDIKSFVQVMEEIYNIQSKTPKQFFIPKTSNDVEEDMFCLVDKDSEYCSYHNPEGFYCTVVEAQNYVSNSSIEITKRSIYVPMLIATQDAESNNDKIIGTILCASVEPIDGKFKEPSPRFTTGDNIKNWWKQSLRRNQF